MFIEKYTFYLYSRHLLYIVFLINVVVGKNVFWENFLENVISVVYQINMLMDFWGACSIILFCLFLGFKNTLHIFFKK